MRALAEPQALLDGSLIPTSALEWTLPVPGFAFASGCHNIHTLPSRFFDLINKYMGEGKDVNDIHHIWKTNSIQWCHIISWVDSGSSIVWKLE